MRGNAGLYRSCLTRYEVWCTCVSLNVPQPIVEEPLAVHRLVQDSRGIPAIWYYVRRTYLAKQILRSKRLTETRLV